MGTTYSQDYQELKTLLGEKKLIAKDNDLLELTREWRKRFPSLSPREFYDTLTRDTNPESVHIFLHDTFEVHIYLKSGTQMTMEFSANAMEHQGIRVSPNLQGTQQDGRILTRNTADICRYSDIPLIRLKTQEIGGYMWAKCGFLPTKLGWSELQADILQRLKDPDLLNSVQPSGLSLIQKICSSDEPRDLWVLSDLKTSVKTPAGIKPIVRVNEQDSIALGKALLIGQIWHGSLNTKNPEAMQRFDSYMGTSPLSLLPPPPSTQRSAAASL